MIHHSTYGEHVIFKRFDFVTGLRRTHFVEYVAFYRDEIQPKFYDLEITTKFK